MTPLNKSDEDEGFCQSAAYFFNYVYVCPPSLCLSPGTPTTARLLSPLYVPYSALLKRIDSDTSRLRVSGLHTLLHLIAISSRFSRLFSFPVDSLCQRNHLECEFTDFPSIVSHSPVQHNVYCYDHRPYGNADRSRMVWVYEMVY